MVRQHETGAESGDGRFLLSAARFLPLAALGLWIAMLWVPVFASPQRSSGSSQLRSDSPQPPRIIVTALGGPAFDLENAHAGTLLMSLGVIACALAAVLLTLRPHVSLRLWSAATLVLGVCALGVLAALFDEPPMLMWDAVDGRGHRIFDTVIAEPAPGALLWMVGSLILAAAGVCGLIGEHRRGRPTQQPRLTLRPRGDRSARWAQRLPWVAVAAFVLMVWVPIFDRGDHASERVRVTSLGHLPLDDPGFSFSVLPPWAVIVMWMVVLFCAATASWFTPFAALSCCAVGSGLGLLIMEAVMVSNPPKRRVEATDAAGETVSAIIVGYPAVGIHLWTLAALALIGAGAAGLVSARVRRLPRRSPRSRRGHPAGRYPTHTDRAGPQQRHRPD